MSDIANNARKAVEAIVGERETDRLQRCAGMHLPELVKMAAVKAFIYDDEISRDAITRQYLRAYLLELEKKGFVD